MLLCTTVAVVLLLLGLVAQLRRPLHDAHCRPPEARPSPLSPHPARLPLPLPRSLWMQRAPSRRLIVQHPLSPSHQPLLLLLFLLPRRLWLPSGSRSACPRQLCLLQKRAGSMQLSSSPPALLSVLARLLSILL